MVFTEDESGCSKRASQNKCKSQSTNPHSLGIKNVDHYTLRILHNAGLSIWRDLSDWTVYMKQLIKGQDYVLPYLYKKLNTCRDVLGVLKRTTIEQSLVGPRPSDGWIKIGPGGGITDQT
jgi:hypothetical protein